MPEGERDGLFDADEECPWDCDLSAMGEADLADFLDDEEEDDE